MHILNENTIKVDVTTDIVSRLDITNDRIKGQIKVIKTSKDDNFIMVKWQVVQLRMLSSKSTM